MSAFAVNESKTETKHESQFLLSSHFPPKQPSNVKSFGHLKQDLNQWNHKPALRRFYEKQNELIDAFFEAERIRLEAPDNNPKSKNYVSTDVQIATTITFVVNCLLFCCKLSAAIWSGSLAIIASTIDSFLDIGSGSILYFAAKSIRTTNFLKYPEGKSRLEPLAIIIFSIVMGMASLQLITDSFQAIISGLQTGSPNIRIDSFSIAIISVVIGTKTFLLFYCRCLLCRSYNSSIEALASDHRNDVITNSLALTIILLLSNNSQLWFLDPICALVISLYIVFMWSRTARDQMAFVVGITASPELLSQMTYIAMHHPDVSQVDTVRAYHIGQGYLCEVDVVLPGETMLQKAHDIGESLEIKLERLDSIQRAFVHLDYECVHSPEYLRRNKETKDTKEQTNLIQTKSTSNDAPSSDSPIKKSKSEKKIQITILPASSFQTSNNQLQQPDNDAAVVQV